MKKYDSYKDSEIEWIGDVPSHWESWKISHAFNRIGSGTTPESGNPIYHENGTINWLNTGDLNDGVLYSCSKKITTKALDDYSSLKLFPTGSLVMAMYGATIGKTAILDFETTTNQACCVFCDSSIIDLKFLQYWFIGNKEQIINLAIGGGQPNISQNILKDIRVWCPDYSEQGSLTHFLDHKTTQIDHLISKKEHFIQLLEEERVAVINQAVTKGLDPNVPMKDSGIEWLGEIPEHWEVKMLKFVTSLITNGFVGPTRDLYYETGVRYIQSLHIKKGKIDFERSPYYVSEEWSNEHPRSILKEGDVLVVQTGAVGEVAMVDKDYEDCNCHALIIVRTNEKLIPVFLLNLLESSFGKAQMKLIETGALHQHINSTKLKDIITIVPPIEEQSQIVRFIEEQRGRIQTIINKTQQEIELLKEYKTALISEVVTGKVDVRNEKLNS